MDPDAYWEALTVINNWRSAHAFPLNTFQMTLRRKAEQVDTASIVAQRIKRLSSIEHKLRRLKWLQLAEMQDIGGCRAVVNSVRHVNDLVATYKDSDIRHELIDEDDYIRNPRSSGYRGYHLIYKYYSEKKGTYNGLKVEMQFRSSLQHAWATAVETVGTFIEQSLKSSEGEADWLRFFALMGTDLALREDMPPVPGTPTGVSELVKELREYARKLDVENRLRAYGLALRTIEEPHMKRGHYFLLELNPAAGTLSVTSYSSMQLEKASTDYLESERNISTMSGAQTVLVSVESVNALRRAYPNYFLDTNAFLAEVKKAIA